MDHPSHLSDVLLRVFGRIFRICRSIAYAARMRFIELL